MTRYCRIGRSETAVSINDKLAALCLPLGTVVQRHRQPTASTTVAMGLALDVHTRFLPRTRCSDDEKGARLISFRRHRPYSRRPERRGTAKKKLFDVLRAFSAPILHHVPAPQRDLENLLVVAAQPFVKCPETRSASSWLAKLPEKLQYRAILYCSSDPRRSVTHSRASRS